jgi:hypothetical protein
VGLHAGDLQHDADAWRGITWGLVEGFRNWMVQQGDAVGSINVRLSTVKAYAKLAVKAGAPERRSLRPDPHLVAGYSRQGELRQRTAEVTRRGRKASAVHMDKKQAKRLRAVQPDTPQGRRTRCCYARCSTGLRVGKWHG